MERSTISQAMLRVSELERIYRDKMYTMMRLENIVQEYILESDGTRYDCNEVVDFNREFELIIELGQEISTIKTNISKANNENYIETKNGKLSLQGTLNRIKYLREQVNNFENILDGVKSSKERKVDAAATSVYYRVKEPNFNKKELKKNLKGIDAANITTRNFPISVAELRKKLKIKEGGENYIFATSDAKNNHLLLICKKTKRR